MPPRQQPSITSIDRLVQLADQLSDPQIERLISLLEALLVARQAPPGQEELQEGEVTELNTRKARIELKYIPDSRGSGAVYGPYKYLRYFQGKKHRSLYLGKGESNPSREDKD